LCELQAKDELEKQAKGICKNHIKQLSNAMQAQKLGEFRNFTGYVK